MGAHEYLFFYGGKGRGEKNKIFKGALFGQKTYTNVHTYTWEGRIVQYGLFFDVCMHVMYVTMEFSCNIFYQAQIRAIFFASGVH